MDYEIIYGEGALDRVFSLDMPEVVDCVEKAMNRLADNPLLHGRRGRDVSQLPNGQIIRWQEFNFYCDSGPGHRVHFRAHFYYGDDEHSLRVVRIVVVPFLRL